jgi:hypothetical protein
MNRFDTVVDEEMTKQGHTVGLKQQKFPFRFVAIQASETTDSIFQKKKKTTCPSSGNHFLTESSRFGWFLWH